MNRSSGETSAATSKGLRANERIGGDRAVTIEKDAQGYRAGKASIDTALPVDYPDPTPPGAIELKHYPSVRLARTSGKGGLLSDQRGFWPLFKHITDRDIPMTAPVEMESTAYDPETWGSATEWSMAFLYRTADQGPLMKDDLVEVVDSPPRTVVSLGMRGDLEPARVRDGVKQLREFLAQQDEWREAGAPVALGYNGPNVPARDRWIEVQVPVKQKN